MGSCGRGGVYGRKDIESAQVASCGTFGIRRTGPPEDGKPTLGWGKYSVRLYAGRIRRGKAPAPPAPEGEKEDTMQKRKTEIITARMTPKVKAQLQQKAQDANMTLTDYLCICGLGQEIVRVEGLDEVLSELKAQGRNLSQLTTLANMGRLTVLRSDELIDKYADLCAAIRRLTKEVS